MGKFHALLTTSLIGVLASQLAIAGEKENAIKANAEAKLGIQITSIQKAPLLGLYELESNGNLLYTDEKTSAFVAGALIDGKTMRNVTEERRNKLMAIKFSDLPLNQAIKIVRGNGKRVMATFEDPNCGYCKKLATELQHLDNVTIYTFMVPILSPDSQEKSTRIWCSKDPAAAWNNLMLTGKEPPTEASCNNPTEANKTLAQKLRVTGTPTIFFADGQRVPGYLPMVELAKRLGG